MKRFLLILAVCLAALPGTAAAHVLIGDETRSVGAILHITPDDDPVAGEQSSIAFIIEGQAVSNKTHAFTLHAIDGQNQKSYISIQANGSTITAAYAFPVQGVYELILVAEPLTGRGKTLTFRHDQLVARGEAAEATDNVAASLGAQLGLITALTALLIIIATVYSRRKILMAYAKAKTS